MCINHQIFSFAHLFLCSSFCAIIYCVLHSCCRLFVFVVGADVICFCFGSYFVSFFFIGQRGKESDVLFTITHDFEPHRALRSYWCSREICLQQILKQNYVVGQCEITFYTLSLATNCDLVVHTQLFTVDVRE